MRVRIQALAATVGVVAACGMAAGEQIVDPAGDLINGFTAAANPDLDVLLAEVFYDVTTEVFTFTSTSAGPTGTTPNSAFVWGVNRGAGTAGFAASGLPNVLFDRVVVLRPGGVSQIAGGGLPVIDLAPGAVTFDGANITAVVAASLLPSTGFALTDYTVNLWPRTTPPSGFAGISDFAPDTNNAGVTVIPAPGAAALLAVGGLAGLRRRR